MSSTSLLSANLDSTTSASALSPASSKLEIGIAVDDVVSTSSPHLSLSTSSRSSVQILTLSGSCDAVVSPERGA